MLDSGHSVPHSKEAQGYEDFNVPPKIYPMVPREKRKIIKVDIDRLNRPMRNYEQTMAGYVTGNFHLNKTLEATLGRKVSTQSKVKFQD